MDYPNGLSKWTILKWTTPKNNISDEYYLMIDDGQNTDPQSMDYPNGLPKWTTLKWTTPKNNIPNEYYLMFLAASRLKLHIYKFQVLFIQRPVHVDHWKIDRDNADVNAGKPSIA